MAETIVINGVPKATVKGRFMLAYADHDPNDQQPDLVPAEGRRIEFTPSVHAVKYRDAQGGVAIFPTRVSCKIDYDGWVTGPDGEPEVVLLATSGEIDPAGWTWQVSSPDLEFEAFSIQLEPGSTVDLGAVAPVEATPGVARVPDTMIVVRAEATLAKADEALAAIMEANQTAAGLQDAVQGGVESAAASAEQAAASAASMTGAVEQVNAAAARVEETAQDAVKQLEAQSADATKQLESYTQEFATALSDVWDDLDKTLDAQDQSVAKQLETQTQSVVDQLDAQGNRFTELLGDVEGVAGALAARLEEAETSVAAVGETAAALDEQVAYVRSAVEQYGGIPGPKGDPGEPGKDGEKGEPGEPGKAATISVGTVKTGAPGTSVVVENVGSATDTMLNFTIPRGSKGDKGDPGKDGAPGKDGKDGPQGPAGDTIKNTRTGTAMSIWIGTQSQYTSLTSKDSNTIYFIQG